MVNNKKIDEQDLVFLNQAWTVEEKQSFSNYLKSRKKPRLAPKEKRNNSSNNYPAAG